MEWLAIALSKMYDFTRAMPRWLLYVITGAVGSLIIQLLHRSDASKKVTKKAAAGPRVAGATSSAGNPAVVAPATATEAEPPAEGTSSGVAKKQPATPTPKGKSKKGGKK
jgi:hypothetical protein